MATIDRSRLTQLHERETHHFVSEHPQSAALYQRAGEELLSASVTNAELKQKVLTILADRETPVRMESLQRALQNQQSAKELLAQTLPADAFYLAVEFRKRYPDQASTAPAIGDSVLPSVQIPDQYATR